MIHVIGVHEIPHSQLLGFTTQILHAEARSHFSVLEAAYLFCTGESYAQTSKRKD